MSEELIKKPSRTEEVQEIIDRMPSTFGTWITCIVLVLVTAMGILGWLIKYPDVVMGQIVINANNSPVKLVASTSGKLLLNKFHSQDNVNEEEYIAVIQNAARPEDIYKVHSLIRSFKINSSDMRVAVSAFPRNVSLGDLNAKYFVFINACEKFLNYYDDNLLTKQEEILSKILKEQQNILEVNNRKLNMSSENVRLMNKFYKRDSILFSKKVLTESEMDKSQMNNISANDAYQTMMNNITSVKEQIQETDNKLQQNAIQKTEKEKQVQLDLISAYTDLLDNFKVWEQRYVFKAPVKGKVQFLKFWANDQFIQAGEPAFTIVPLKSKIIGQMSLPSAGAGKVKVGQEVIIKLDNYPYTEFGSIQGRISSISLTTNVLRTEKGDLETYLINVELPEQLKTNYGSSLDFKYEIKGIGEIITNNRRLIERLFDNLKYVLKK